MCRTTGLLVTVKAVTYEEQVRAMRAESSPYPWVDSSRVEIDAVAASRSQLQDLRRKSGRLPWVAPLCRIE
jgi:hypothetical protein